MFQEFVLEHPQIEHFETPVSDSELLPQGIKLSVLSWISDIRGTVFNIVHWQQRQTSEGKEQCEQQTVWFLKTACWHMYSLNLGVFIGGKKWVVTTQ